MAMFRLVYQHRQEYGVCKRSGAAVDDEANLDHGENRVGLGWVLGRILR